MVVVPGFRLRALFSMGHCVKHTFTWERHHNANMDSLRSKNSHVAACLPLSTTPWVIAPECEHGDRLIFAHNAFVHNYNMGSSRPHADGRELSEYSVNEIVPKDQVLTRAVACAEEMIQKCSPEAVQCTKHGILLSMRHADVEKATIEHMHSPESNRVYKGENIKVSSSFRVGTGSRTRMATMLPPFVPVPCALVSAPY